MPSANTRFAVLLFTDIVGSTELKAAHGVPAYKEALQRHNAHFERLARECHEITVLHNMGDGYFAEARSVTEAVRFALLFQSAMRDERWGEVCLATRLGIHAGEVTATDASGGSGIVAPAADLAARVMSLAHGGQILMTRFPFDEARHFLREHPTSAGKPAPRLCWLAHGLYLLKGRVEPMDIFEVGAEGLAPLSPPPDGEKAKRAIRPGEEETLGWRPALGLEIPGRPGWRLTERRGAGGFGEVWVGEQVKLRQQRAFKFCFDDERLRALKREVTLVRLLRTTLGEREDIVRFHDLKLDAPPFYLESDLAPHGNLLQWAEKQGGLAKIPLTQRLALVARTAIALAAAHSIGVLHKDIKPTNILIFDAADGTPHPRLVDFGIGTLADHGVLAEQGITTAGFTRATLLHSSGTPTYSPPEFIAGKPYTIQSDIYGLGVLLYQLIITDPTRPLAVGWERDISDPLLREDIALSVDGDPARRLPSAAELADRLQRLESRREDIIKQEQLAREAFARVEAERKLLESQQREQEERRRREEMERVLEVAKTAREQAEERNRELRALLAECARSDRLIAEEKLAAGLERDSFAYLARSCDYDQSSTLGAEKALAVLNRWWHPVPSEVLLGHSESVWNARFSSNGRLVLTVSQDRTAKVWDALNGSLVCILEGHMAPVWDGFFSSDGSRIVTGSDDNTVRVWDATTGCQLHTITGHKGPVTSVQFNREGTRLVTASHDLTARVWDVATGSQIARLGGHSEWVRSAQFSPDGSRIVTASDDRTVRVWEAETGQVIHQLMGHEAPVMGAQFSPDGVRIVSASHDLTARIWNADTGEPVATLAGHDGYVNVAQFSPDGEQVVTASEDKTARVWDAASGKHVATLNAHEDGVKNAEFSPDGSKVMTTAFSTHAIIWEVRGGKLAAVLSGHGGAVLNAHFGSDSASCVTASADKTVRLWKNVCTERVAIRVKHSREVRDGRFSPDGLRFVTASDDRTAAIWCANTGRKLITLQGHTRWVTAARFSPDGTKVATASEDLTVRIWDATAGSCCFQLTGHAGRLTDLQFDSSGDRLVTTSFDGNARIWNANDGSLEHILAGHGDRVNGAHITQDGKRIVTVSDDKAARVWDANSGELLLTLLGHDSSVKNGQFSPSGTMIVTASSDRTARIWDAVSGDLLRVLGGHKGPVRLAGFTKDETRVYTTSEDTIARVWNLTNGNNCFTLSGHRDLITCIEFSAQGERIVTGSTNGTAILWDGNSGQRIATLSGHGLGVTSVSFNPAGDRILTASADHSARIWALLPPRASAPPKWFSDFLRYLSQRRLNSDGVLERIKAEDWLLLRKQLRKCSVESDDQDSPYLQILQKFMAR